MAFIGNRSPQSFLLRAMAQRRQGGQGGMQPAPMQNRKGGSQGKPWSKVRQQEQMAQRQMPPPPNYAQAQREQAMQQRGWTPNETNQILSGQQRQGGIADLMQQRGQAMQGLMGGAGDIYGQQRALQQRGQAMQGLMGGAGDIYGQQRALQQQQLQQAPQGNRKGGGMQQAPQGSRKGA